MKSTHTNIFLAASILGALAAIPAQADVRLNGFGQAIVGSTLNDNRPYPNISYDADPKFDQESLFALQASARLTDKLSATAQLVGSGNRNSNFNARFEWAYVGYQFNNHWSAKFGRQRDPLFYYSDYLEVGTALPWLRTPTAVYATTSNFSNIDGISINYSTSIGKWLLEPGAIYGRFSGDFTVSNSSSPPAQLDLANAVGGWINATYDEWLHLRAAYFRQSITLTGTSVDQLTSALTSAGLSSAAGNLAIDGDFNTFRELGFTADYAKFVFLGEYVELSTNHSFAASAHNWYLGVGRHFGKFLPLFTYGRRNEASSTEVLNTLGRNNPFFGAASAAINAQKVLDTFYQFDLRYDLSNNVALKGNFTIYDSAVPGVKSTNLISAGIAFSF